MHISIHFRTCPNKDLQNFQQEPQGWFTSVWKATRTQYRPQANYALRGRVSIRDLEQIKNSGHVRASRVQLGAKLDGNAH